MTSKPVSAMRKFGSNEPDEIESRKKKRSKNIQLFKKPWRAFQKTMES
jgi:hypothetical protein